MEKKRKDRAKFLTGFTLIELMVVIAIIGLLSSIVFSSFRLAARKARDARRKAEVHQIVTALYLYHEKYGNWVEEGSNCGGNGVGDGYYNYVGVDQYRYYPGRSISQCVSEVTGGAEIIDPSGGTLPWGQSPNRVIGYMKFTCEREGKKYTYVYTGLEGVPVTHEATSGTCIDLYRYGMNYYQEIID